MSDDVVIVVRAQDQASGALRQVHAELQRAGAAAKSSGAQASASASGWAAAGTGAAKAGTQARDAGGKFVAAGAAAKMSAGTAAAAATGWGRVGLSLDAASKKAVLFRNAYRDALDDRHIRAYDVAGAALIGTFALSVTAAAGFEKQLSSLRAVSGATADEMEALSAAALKAGADTAFSASDAARAQTELAKAGVATSDILGGALAGSLDLAAAGGLDLGRAAEIAASSMNMFNLAGRDVAMIADTLASGANKSAAGVDDLAQALSMGGTMASQLGMSIQETTGLLSMFADRGIKGSDAGTMLKTMLMRLTPTSAEAADAMRQFGISGYDATGAFIGVSELARQLQGSLGKLSQEQQNTALTTIFGADAYRAAAIIMNEGAAKVDQYTTAMTDQGAAARMAGTMMDNLAGDLEELKGSLETGLIKSGSSANEVLRGMTQFATGLLNTVTALPTPVLAIGSAATLAAGGFLILAPRIVAAKIALDSIATSAPRASGALMGVAKTAGVVTAAFFGLQVAGNWWDEFTGQTVKGGAQAASTLEQVAESGQMTAEAWKALGSNGMDMAAGLEGILNRDWLNNAGAFGTYVSSLGGILPWADEAGTSIEGAAKAFDSMDAGLATMVADGNIEGAAKALSVVTTEAARQSIGLDQVMTLFPQYTAALETAKAAGVDLTSGLVDTADSLTMVRQGTAAATLEASRMAIGMAKAEAAARSLSAALQLGNSYLDARDAARQYQAALDDFDKSLKDNGKTFDDNTAKGRTNSAALDDIARAAKAAYTATDEAGNVAVTNAKAYRDSAAAYYENARALGMSASEAAVLTSNVYGASVAADALSNKKINPKVKADVKGLEGQLKAAQDKLSGLESKPASAKVNAKIENAKTKITEIEDALSILKGKKTDPKVEAQTDTAEQAIGRTSTALTDLDGQRATVYIDVVQNRPIPNTPTTDGGDTATTQAKAGFSMPGKALHRTLAAHHSIASSLGGGFRITNLLTGGGGKGRGSGDHQSGRAVDVQGPRMGDYIQAVRAQGGFAEMHGSGRGRHVHAVMGDTASPARVTTARGGDTFQFYWYGTVSGTDESTVKAWVRDAVRQVERSKRERSAS